MSLKQKDLQSIRARADAAMPGPWMACCADKPTGCAHVMHADGMIAEVTKGKWGDEWPSLRFVEGSEGTIGRQVEAYMEMIEYGEISAEAAQANKVFIAHARQDVPALLDELERVRAIAKMEELEHCDPNGTWYDVAQSALKKLDQLEKIAADCDCKKDACVGVRAKAHIAIMDMQIAMTEVDRLKALIMHGRRTVNTTPPSDTNKIVNTKQPPEPEQMNGAADQHGGEDFPSSDSF